MVSWDKETWSITEIEPNPRNPRRLEKARLQQLKESIDTFGACQALVVNRDGMIIGGHQRYLAYKELNIKWIDVMVPHRHLDDREVEELSIRLNRHAGDWDYDVLANEFEVEDLLNWGFDSKELGMPSIDEMLEDAKPEKQRKITFTATFETSEALEQVEDDLVALIDRVGGSYKTKS